MKKRRVATLTALMLFALLLLAGVALANGVYEIPWFTADGGGGTWSEGGGFSLGGTIGQSDAGTLVGGAYTLLGGFWAGSGPGNYGYLPVIIR
jgi:hypothetical protein